MTARHAGRLAALVAVLGLGGGFVLRTAGSRAAPADAADTTVVSRSIAFFEARLAADPINTLYTGQLVNRYVVRFGLGAALADLERAEVLAARAVGLARDRSSALSRLSGVLLMQHKFAEALETAERAFAADSGSTEAAGALLEATLAAGRYPLAAGLAARLDRRSLAGRVRAALYLDAEGDSDAALALLDSACDELERTAGPPPVRAWCLTQLASLQWAVHGSGEARATLRQALRVQPGYRTAIERLADLALAGGQARAALRGYRQVASDAHPDLYLRQAEALRFLGRTAEAAEAEQRFLTVAGAPEREPLFGAGLALYHLEGDRGLGPDSALALAQREVARRPTVEAFDLLAWVHFRRGELPAALAAADRAAGWGGGTPTARFHRGMILRAAGRIAEGDRLLAEAATRPDLLPWYARRALERRPAPAGRLARS